jgi:ABC-type multidrug transport system fused ATPase/permease subunit
VGITGPVGSGKSALARALLGLYPLESGHILLGGRRIEDIPVAERAAQTGYLAQEPYLFSGTIRENILLGSLLADKDKAEAVLEASISTAVLNEDLRGFTDGLETQIGELGIRVSGGQRQRIALARAIATSSPKIPGLLVLDDPFSAVDVDTETRIVAGLRQLLGQKTAPEEQSTIILFSHRLAAFSHADLVVVLDDGQIKERGTHAELIQLGGLYGRIYRAQLQVRRGGAGQEEPL